MDCLIQYVWSLQLAPDEERRLDMADLVISEIGPALIGFIGLKVPRSDVDDVFQETMIAIAQGVIEFKGETSSSFWSWCNQIARHKIADYYRKTQRKPVDFVDPMLLHNIPANEDDKIDPRLILQLLGQSDPEAFQIAWDHYILGIAWVDLAVTNGKTEGALRKKVERALESIQDQILELYG